MNATSFNVKHLDKLIRKWVSYNPIPDFSTQRPLVTWMYDHERVYSIKYTWFPCSIYILIMGQKVLDQKLFLVSQYVQIPEMSLL